MYPLAVLRAASFASLSSFATASSLTAASEIDLIASLALAAATLAVNSDLASVERYLRLLISVVASDLAFSRPFVALAFTNKSDTAVFVTAASTFEAKSCF